MRAWRALNGNMRPFSFTVRGRKLAQLLYETTDSAFADRALSALQDAEIGCYKTGRGYTEPGSHLRGLPTESQVCIYIEQDADYARANDILIKLGAVIDAPPSSTALRYLFIVAAVGAVLVFWIVSNSK